MSVQLNFNEYMLDEINHIGLYKTIIHYFPFIDVVIKQHGDIRPQSYMYILIRKYILQVDKYHKKDLQIFLGLTEFDDYDKIYIALIHWINKNEELLQLRML